MSYTNLGVYLQTPGDPAVANAWGANLNTDFTLLDNAISGILTLSVAGASNVVLTVANGSADQSRNNKFTLTGALTGNIYVLWPAGRTQAFSVFNNTTGAFTLGAGVNNGAGAPAGATITVPQGGVADLFSDGTNVTARVDNVGIGLPTGTTGHVVPFLDGANTFYANSNAFWVQTITNSSNGTNAQAVWRNVNDLTHYGYVNLTSSGLTATGIYNPDSFLVVTNAATEMVVGTVSNAPLWFVTNNNFRGYVDAGGGFVIGVPSGGSLGVGTINAVTLYQNGTAISSLFDASGAAATAQSNAQSYAASNTTTQITALNLGNVSQAKRFATGQIALPGAGSATSNYTHNLGSTPNGFNVVMVCTTAEGGYSVGDTTTPTMNDASNSHGLQVYANSTTVGAIEGTSGIYVLNKGTGGNFKITDANWKVIIFAILY